MTEKSLASLHLKGMLKTVWFARLQLLN